MWPRELLTQDLDPSCRLYSLQYEARELERANLIYNLPDKTIDEFAQSIYDDLQQAGLLNPKEPLLFVSYSLGGLVTRSLIINHLKKDGRSNLMGVLFVASPLNGSEMEGQIMADLKPVISFLLPATDIFESIGKDEFVDHFRYVGFPCSAVVNNI